MRFPGVEGAVLPETENVRAVLLPHALLAVTEMVPPVFVVVTVMLLVVDVPDQPEGKVQV
jgi:hypothetical protein